MEPPCSEKFICCCSRRDSCTLPLRCMLPSLRSPPSAKLPPLCACEPRRPRADIQAVPCGACSDTRLLPASDSQPPSAQIRSVRTYNTIIYTYFKVKTVITFYYISRTRPVIPQNRKHRLIQTLSLVPRRALARAAGERRIPLVCTHAHVSTARSGAETPQGGVPAIPTQIGSDKKSTYNADNRITHQQISVLYMYIYIYCHLASAARRPRRGADPHAGKALAAEGYRWAQASRRNEA